MTSPTEQLTLNGIDGATGQYLVPPIELPTAAQVADPNGERPFFEQWRQRLRELAMGISFGLPPDADPKDPARAGWGVVFHEQATEEFRKSLEPLINHRRAQVEADRMHVLTYRQGETAQQFLDRHGVPIGDVEPTRVPYYLLLVGGPDTIPYEVQHSLALSYAVGRVSLENTKEYTRYADSVVDYEKGATVPNHRQVTYWGPRHLGDQSTQLSADNLVTPLARGAPADQAPQLDKTLATKLRYASRDYIEDDATKEKLLATLQGGDVRPAVLFTASHGLGFPANDSRQAAAQGALLCQDWTGLGQMTPGHYLAASDVGDDARLHGLVAFFFACFGAGTPLRDEFPRATDRHGNALTAAPFVSALPRRLLSHPQGGALAVIGHVERARGFSIRPVNLSQSTLHPFRNTLWKIMTGEPVGHAVRDFRDRFSVANNILLTHLDANTPTGKLPPRELLLRWIERNDARNYVVLGDPAVRVRQNDLQAVP